MVSSLAVRREEDKNMIHRSNMQMFEHVDAWWTRLMRLPSASCLAMRSCSSRAFFSSSSILLSSAAIGFRLSERKETHIDYRGKLKRGNSRKHGENMQTPHRDLSGIWTQDLLTVDTVLTTVPPCCWVFNMCAMTENNSPYLLLP